MAPTPSDLAKARELFDTSYSILTGHATAVRTGVMRSPCDPIRVSSPDPNCGKHTWVLATFRVDEQLKGVVGATVRVFDFTHGTYGTPEDKPWARVGEAMFLVLRPQDAFLDLRPQDPGSPHPFSAQMTPDFRFEIAGNGQLIDSTPNGSPYFSSMTVPSFRVVARAERARLLGLGDPTYKPTGPYGPLRLLSKRYVCLGFAGGRIPPTPINTCFRRIVDLRVGPGVARGVFVEVHLIKGRTASVEVYRGRRNI